jgi:hypothetical protein
MTLTFNSDDARKADNISSVIRESGKYVGVITRAQKLFSEKGTEGFGLSIKTDDGASANYLDIWTVNAAGEKLRGYNIVQAIMCCTRTREAKEDDITFERWDRDEGGMVKVTEVGYPALMGKKIGLVLQKELQTNNRTGADVERLNIVAPFEAATNLTASEILDKKTKPEKPDAMVAMIMRTPVRDTRKRDATRPASAATASPAVEPLDDDIPF